MKDLKVGMSFYVVEWLGDSFSKYEKSRIGCQGVIDNDGFIFASNENGYILANDDETKPIGKLTITSLK